MNLDITRSINDFTINEDNTIEYFIATETPIKMPNGIYQILRCTAEAVDTTAHKTIMINHDANQIAGGVLSTEFAIKDGINGIKCKGMIDPEAKFQSGVNVLRALKSKMVTGFSTGGKTKKVMLDENGNQIVEEWELRESTITPIPADVNSALIRQIQKKEDNMTENTNSDKVAQLELQRDIALTASNLGLDAEPYIKETSLVGAIKRMNADRAAKQIPQTPNQPVTVNINADEVDKINRKFASALLFQNGQKVNEEELKGNNAVGINRFTDLVKEYAAQRHQEVPRNTNEIARGIIQRGYNTVTDAFSSYVLANAMNKAVMNGFNAYGSDSTYQIWCKIKEVSDFKTFTAAAVAVGTLTETPENSPFSEIVKNDMGYSSALKMYGGTVSLSEQVMVNDDLNQFMEILSRAGYLANREIDYQVYYALENATWTGNTTSSATLATAGNLDKVRAAFRSKTDPSGKLLGVTPKFLIHTPSQAKYAAEATWNVTAPGATALFSSPATRGMIPVESPFLSGTSTTYYLAADPMVADGVYVAFLRGQRAPVIEEQGITAVAGRAWNIKLPFVAGIASTTVGSTIYMPGLQQGTA